MLDLAEDHVDAKILLIDIETAPILGWAWQKYETTLLHIEKDWEILSVSWKWLHKNKIITTARDEYSEKQITNIMWKLFDASDIVIGHNGDKFDIKKIQTKMKIYKLSPPSPFKSVDTLKVARAHFKFTSNKLDDLCRDMGLGEKIEINGVPLWLACAKGDKKAIRKLKKYNKRDVELLQSLYIELRPWMPRHPNIGVYKGHAEEVCGSCGSDNIQTRGYYHTNTMSYPRYSCRDCGTWGRMRRGVQRGTKGIVCDRK